MAVGARCGWGWQAEAGIAVLRLEARAEEKQTNTVDWTGSPWEQQGTEEDFAEGAEQQLLGEGHSSLRDDNKRQGKLAQARVDGLGVYWMCTLMGVQTEQAHHQPLRNMASWSVAQMRTHWRSGLKGQHGWVVSLRRWTPLELNCWRPMHC